MLLWLRGKNIDYLAVREKAEIVEQLPFSTENKYMATIVRSAVTGKRTMYVTGAPDILLAMCGDKDNKDYNVRLITMRTDGVLLEIS